MKKIKESLFTVQSYSILGICILFLVTMIIAFVMRPNIFFKQRTINLEINSHIDLVQNFQQFKKIDASKLIIDDSQLDITQVGTYPVQCIYQNKKYKLNIKIVDTKPPTFETLPLSIELNEHINPNLLVQNIQDDTKTTVYLKDKYPTHTVGEMVVTVIVEDECKNITKKDTIVTILPPDTTPPTIVGTTNLTTTIGKDVNYMKNVEVKDDRDTNPSLKIDSSNVNIHKHGIYPVTYIAKDKSGNKTTVQIKLHVNEEINQPNEKVVYLTFDDGPSQNTKKILDVLNQYNVKATFFVTGANQNYYHLIKEAHDQGHTIGLHTFSHSYASVYSSTDAYFDDLGKIASIVQEQIGYIPPYVRFPGGSSNTISAKYTKGIMSELSHMLHQQGYEYYDWNISSGDADGDHVPVEELVKQSTSTNTKKAMILFHDTNAKKTTIEALPIIIEHYLNKGYRFEAIQENSFIPHHNINN